MRFEGTAHYVADKDLMMAVNVAVAPFKNKQDVHLFEKKAFMTRRRG